MTLIETGPKIQMTRRCCAVGVLLTMACSAIPASESLGQDPQTLTAKEQQTIDRALQTLEQSLKQLRDQSRPRRDLVDADIFHKGLTWALQYDRQFTPADITLLQTAISRGQQRARALARNRKPWAMRKGRVALGYVSQVDESVQPYGVIIPNNYDPSRPIRLDVVLHGSTRPVGLSDGTNPVVQVIEDKSGDVLYTVRAKGGRFQPRVYSRGKHTVNMGLQKPDAKTVADLEPKPKSTAGELYVSI